MTGGCRGGRVHALRHLRLPARPDAGHPARPRRRGRYGRVRGRDGAGPRPLARLLGRLRRGRDRGDVVRAARRDRRRPSSSATRPKTAEGVIQAIMRGDERVDEAAAGDEVGMVVNQTPFYAESGGQVGDTGAIFSAQGGELAVRDTRQEGRRAAPASRHDAARHAARSATRSNCGSMASGAGGCAPTIR